MFVMRDGQIRRPQLSDVKEVAERDERIRQLEKQCEVLSAEIDHQRLVIDAARGVANDDKPGLATGAWVNLRNQLAAYDRHHQTSKPK